MSTPLQPDQALQQGFHFLGHLMESRLAAHFQHDQIKPVSLPDLKQDGSVFFQLMHNEQFNELEVIVLLIALAPHWDPSFFSAALTPFIKNGPDLPIFGGLRGKQHRGILPTGETVQFLLGGDHSSARQAARRLLLPGAKLIEAGLVQLLAPPVGEPPMSGQLIADPEWVERILIGKLAAPSFSAAFPATQVKTTLEWEDLVLPARTMADLRPILHYLEHHHHLDGNSEFGRHARRGYRALFHGPPGTGKTLTAGLIGKMSNRLVFRVDLSMVVSKYIGETEKNLAGLFRKAENKGWILFFDEADALFGKRTDVKESKDRYANQETSYLLQRVENYDGLVILATNFKRNMDKAFTRRFEAIVHFPSPTKEERLLLWEKMWPAKLGAAEDVKLSGIAERYELTGAAIANLLRHATYEAVARGENSISLAQLMLAIRREYEKEERIFSKG